MLLFFSLKEVIIEFIFGDMSKDDAMNIMKKSDLKKVDRYKFFLLYIKNEWDNLLPKKQRDNIK